MKKPFYSYRSSYLWYRPFPYQIYQNLFYPRTNEKPYNNCENKAMGNCSNAQGFRTQAIGDFSHTEGNKTYAKGQGSHAEGQYTKAMKDSSHAEGWNSIANGERSHAEGDITEASGFSSHAEGTGSIAKGMSSHSEGSGTKAMGTSSHAEGSGTLASGDFSHAQGAGTIANGDFSYAGGKNTDTNKQEGAYIIGKFGAADAPYSFYVGNGKSEKEKGLALKLIGSTGDLYIDGYYSCRKSHYDCMFESIDEKGIDAGYFVTFEKEGRKIQKARSTDDILGISTNNPGFLVNDEELRWKNKYKEDAFGNIQYKNEEPIINETFESQRVYIPRAQRMEWVVVALLGLIRVRDDGTCKIGSYCRSNDEGIATLSKTGYRVVDRIHNNEILIFFR